MFRVCTQTRADSCCFIQRVVRLTDPRMPPVMRTIGDQIRACRLDKHMTQAELAESIGVTPAALGQWEANRRIPSARYLPKLTSNLGHLSVQPSAANLTKNARPAMLPHSRVRLAKKVPRTARLTSNAARPLPLPRKKGATVCGPEVYGERWPRLIHMVDLCGGWRTNRRRLTTTRKSTSECQRR